MRGPIPALDTQVQRHHRNAPLGLQIQCLMQSPTVLLSMSQSCHRCVGRCLKVKHVVILFDHAVLELSVMDDPAPCEHVLSFRRQPPP